MSIYKQLAEEQVCQVKEANENQRHQWICELDSIKTENRALQEKLSKETLWQSFLEKKFESLNEIKEKHISFEETLSSHRNSFEKHMKNFMLSLNNQDDFLKHIFKQQENLDLHKENVKQNLQDMNQYLQRLEKCFKAENTKKLEKISE